MPSQKTPHATRARRGAAIRHQPRSGSPFPRDTAGRRAKGRPRRLFAATYERRTQPFLRSETRQGPSATFQTVARRARSYRGFREVGRPDQ